MFSKLTVVLVHGFENRKKKNENAVRAVLHEANIVAITDLHTLYSKQITNSPETLLQPTVMAAQNGMEYFVREV